MNDLAAAISRCHVKDAFMRADGKEMDILYVDDEHFWIRRKAQGLNSGEN